MIVGWVRVGVLSSVYTMSFTPPPFRRFRRSTRVALRIQLEAQAAEQRLRCEAETIVVNLHGALIETPIALSVGTDIDIHVFLTDKRASATVVYVDPAEPLRCGVELARPQNIWGISLPPDDWEDATTVAK
jgi:PilZ domain